MADRLGPAVEAFNQTAAVAFTSALRLATLAFLFACVLFGHTIVDRISCIFGRASGSARTRAHSVRQFVLLLLAVPIPIPCHLDRI